MTIKPVSRSPTRKPLLPVNSLPIIVITLLGY